MRRSISNVLCVIGAPLFGSTLAPRRSIAFRNSAGTWSRAAGKQFGVLGRWRDRHTRPARWSDTLRIRPVRWRKWNRIRIDLARLADPIYIWGRSSPISIITKFGKIQKAVFIYNTNTACLRKSVTQRIFSAFYPYNRMCVGELFIGPCNIIFFSGP